MQLPETVLSCTQTKSLESTGKLQFVPEFKRVTECHSVNEVDSDDDYDDIEIGSPISLNSDIHSDDFLVPDFENPGPDPDDLTALKWGRDHYIRSFPHHLLKRKERNVRQTSSDALVVQDHQNIAYLDALVVQDHQNIAYLGQTVGNVRQTSSDALVVQDHQNIAYLGQTVGNVRQTSSDALVVQDHQNIAYLGQTVGNVSQTSSDALVVQDHQNIAYLGQTVGNVRQTSSDALVVQDHQNIAYLGQTVGDDKNSSLSHKWTLEGHQLGVVSVTTNRAGDLAASSGLDGFIKVWDLESGKLIKNIDGGPVDVWTVAFSMDSSHIATGSHNGKINIFKVEDGKKETVLGTAGKFTMSIAYSPDGKMVASGSIDGIINLYDLQSGKLLHTLEGHAMPVRSLCFSPDSLLLVTASDDREMKIYDIQHANLAGTMCGHGSWVISVAFSPDNQHIVTGSSDKTVKVWDMSTRQCSHTFKDHADQGDGPKLVRELFRVAEEHAPSIVFIDEIDAIGTKRYDSHSGGEREIQRTMLELLNQLDGFDSRGDVKVIMATNRIETLDPALIRPGRIDRKIEFPLPDEKTRRRIFQIHTSKMTLASDLDLEEYITAKDDLSGADIKAICTESGLLALRERRMKVTSEDFRKAKDNVLYRKNEGAPEGLYL
ncbi:hypothetical protein EMCRGX_G030306 [Ephydatia muelleri]